MNFIDKCMAWWEDFYRKAQPALKKAEQTAKVVVNRVTFAWDYIMQYKKLFLATPIAVMAVILAIQNLFKLPALVGFIQDANGEFAFEMIREVAVLAPLIVTAICLLLMFASKRTLTPWMVSLFSLILPLLILFTNTFPA